MAFPEVPREMALARDYATTVLGPTNALSSAEEETLAFSSPHEDIIPGAPEVTNRDYAMWLTAVVGYYAVEEVCQLPEREGGAYMGPIGPSVAGTKVDPAAMVGWLGNLHEEPPLPPAGWGQVSSLHR